MYMYVHRYLVNTNTIFVRRFSSTNLYTVSTHILLIIYLMFREPVKMLIKICFIVENDTFEARVSPKTSRTPPESVHIIHRVS